MISSMYKLSTMEEVLDEARDTSHRVTSIKNDHFDPGACDTTIGIVFDYIEDDAIHG